MRLPNEQKSVAASSDFARGGSLFRSLRSRLSDAVSGAAPQPARVSAGPAVPEREGPAGGGGSGGSAMDANGDAVGRQGTIEVQPVMIRKTPKFPSRERHLAIRRKNRVPPAEMVELAASCPGSPLSVTSGRRLSNCPSRDKILDFVKCSSASSENLHKH
uniref:Uncharacterized protein n=1 Tax=Anopheles merus TaxID=30066 RepID=A0A182UXS8_ANOME